MSRLTRYHFDCGNSNTGHIGFCASIRATSREEATKILHEAVPESISVRPYDDHPAVEYIEVYIATENVEPKDIDSCEPIGTPETPLQEFTEEVWEEENNA